VFAGGWTLGAAEAVGTGGRVMAERVLDLLSELVEKSLVVVEDSPADAGALRYGMLEPIRQFGREKLEENGEAPEARLRHAEHYMALAETAEPELLGSDQDTWLQRLRVEFGNLRAALSWSLQPDRDSRERADELRLRLVAALWRFWDVEGFEEGKQWLQTALERDPGGFPASGPRRSGGSASSSCSSKTTGRPLPPSKRPSRSTKNSAIGRAPRSRSLASDGPYCTDFTTSAYRLSSGRAKP
jgi:hypothetical protein